MGGGSRTPTDSPVNTGDGAFEGRKSPSASGSTDGASDAATTTTHGSDSTSGSTTGVSGSPNTASELWENNDNPPESYAATYDLGYDSKLAEHLKSQPTAALEEKFEAAKQSARNGGRLSKGDRFIGGMLASRSDSSVEASDVTTIEVNADSVDGRQTIDEFNDMVERDLNEAIESMDEYVAGKVTSRLQTIKVQEIGTADNGRHISGQYDMAGTMKVAPMEHNSESTVTHELAHVVEHSYNSVTNTRNDTETGSVTEFSIERQNIREMSLTGESLNAAETHAFNNGLEDITQNLYDTVSGENNPGMRKYMRNYQLTNSSETFAVGFGKYKEDFIAMSNHQSDLVNHIDSHVTGGGWEPTELNELRTSGGIQNQNVNKSHAPIGTNEESIGEVVKVNYETPQPANNAELPDREHVTGHVTETTDNSITVFEEGQEKEIHTSLIDSVETRTEVTENT